MTDIETMPTADLLGEVERCRTAIDECEIILTDLRDRAGAYREELARRSLEEGLPRISAHAMLRYLERVRGVDLLAIEKEMLDDGLIGAIKAGATRVKRGRLHFVVNRNVVKTVLLKEGSRARARRHLRGRDQFG
jgi:hypothetical protein